MAQLGARQTGSLKVRGSTPLGSTNSDAPDGGTQPLHSLAFQRQHAPEPFAALSIMPRTMTAELCSRCEAPRSVAAKRLTGLAPGLVAARIGPVAGDSPLVVSRVALTRDAQSPTDRMNGFVEDTFGRRAGHREGGEGRPSRE